jgi:hypothetical protein
VIWNRNAALSRSIVKRGQEWRESDPFCGSTGRFSHVATQKIA